MCCIHHFILINFISRNNRRERDLLSDQDAPHPSGVLGQHYLANPRHFRCVLWPLTGARALTHFFPSGLFIIILSTPSPPPSLVRLLSCTSHALASALSFHTRANPTNPPHALTPRTLTPTRCMPFFSSKSFSNTRSLARPHPFTRRLLLRHGLLDEC